MRTYKEPKRIDKPQARDSAIRQLNADASKFAAIRSAAISIQEEDNEGSTQTSTNNLQANANSPCKNHVTQEHIEQDTAVDLSKHANKDPHPRSQAPVASNDINCEVQNEEHGIEDKLNSSYSSSSIPTDSVISSSSKSDLDLSFTSIEQNNTFPKESYESVDNAADGENNDIVAEGMGILDNSEVNSKENEKDSDVPVTKKKSSPKQSKKQKAKVGGMKKGNSGDKMKEARVLKKKAVKKVLKSDKKLSKNMIGNTVVPKGNVPKARGRPKGAKGKKKQKEESTEMANDLKIDTNVPSDNSSAVSPRSSKRTPKKNRKYDSDEESHTRKLSPRAGKKRKLVFDMEDEEFEEGLIEGFDVKEDKDVKEKEETKSKSPPKKRKKQMKSSTNEGNEEVKEDADENLNLDGTEVTKKKKKQIKPKVLNSEHIDKNAGTEKQVGEKGTISKKKKKSKLKVKKSGEVQSDTLDTSEKPKSEEESVLNDMSSQIKYESASNSAMKNDMPVVKKRKYVRKKPLKSQEINKIVEEEEENEEKETDGANDLSVIGNEKKDQISISCPLCGHISHSKSANTRHIKRCVNEDDKLKMEDLKANESTEKEEPIKEAEEEEEELSKEEEQSLQDTSQVDDDASHKDSSYNDNEGDISLTEEEIHLLAKDFALDYMDNSSEILNSSSEKKIVNLAEFSNREFPSDISDIIKKRAPNSLFMCEHCDYCTPKRAMLGRHLRIHGIFVCLRCNYICDTRSKLKEHVLEVHRDRADYKLCRNCSRYVKCADITIEQHMEICQGPVPFKCPHCDKEFKYESSLKSHVIRHNPDAPKKFHCPECPYESNYKANLKKHLKNIHSDKTETEYKCPFADCEKIFHTQDNLKRHFKFHSDERPHACTKCDKKFKTAAALRGHYVVHSPSRPFKCNINDCTKDFRSKKLLKNHMEEFHNLTEKKYACDYAGCDFAFFKRSHLERHKITHTGERKFGCTACGKAFRHSDNLKVHMRQHTNEKPVKCHLCSFACRQKSSLQYHLRKFHQIFNRPRSISSEAKNLSTLVSAVYSSVDDGLTSSVSSESKENHQGLPLDSKEEIEEQKNTEPFSPIKKSQNAMDLYEFRSDEEFGDDSILMPLRQERTSTPLRPEKISSHQSVSFDENSESSDKTDTKLDDQQSSTLSEKNSGEIVESIKIEDIIIEEVVKFAENNEGESSFVKNDQVKEPEEPVKVLPKPKKKPGRKKGFKLKPKTEETAKPIKDKDEAKNPESEEVTEKAEPPAKPKGKRGRKPKAQKLLEQAEKVEAKNTSEEKPQEKPPRKKPGPKPKKDKDKKEVDKAVKIPKKRGPKKKKVVPVDDNTEDQEEPSPPRKKRKYTRRKSTGKKPGRKPKGEKADKEDSVEEEEETIIYSELDQNTAKEDEDDGEATEIEGFDDDDRKSPSIEEKAEEKVEESEEIVEVPEKIQEENDNKDPQSPVIEEEEEEEKDKADTAIVPEVTENEAVAKVEVEEKKGEEESERMSSGIDTDFEEDLKPPPAPRPPPVVDSDEGDIESGPEEMDTPGRDFESTPPKSVQNHSVQSLRDYESTPPKSVQPDSVPNYGSIENKNDVLSPELQQPPSQPPLSQGYTEDRSELSNPVPSNISYAPPGSVELPGSAQSVPQATSQNGQEYVSQSDSTMPEVDKDYLGQYLQQFDSNRSEDENNRLSQAEERPEDHLNIPTSPQKELSSLNMSSPGVPPLNLSTSSDRGEGIPPKGTDMSNKRMEILSVDRQHEEHFQTRSENPSRSSERIPDNVYDSISSMNSYLPPGSRETPTIFPPTSTSTPYMPFSENEAILQRQRMTTPFLAQNDQNALQNLHRMTDSALASNNPSSLLRRPTTVPSREEIFSNPSAVAQSMARNPFHSTWSSQDVRHPHWSQTPYLQRPIDRQSGTTTNSLFAKDNYLTGRDFVFDTSRRSVTERNMFPGLAQSQRPELPHETFPSNERFDFSYFGLPGYPGAPTLDYARSAGTTSQKTFDERYRQTTGSMADFRGLPQSTTSEMFRSMNSTFNFDKYMYARDPMYHTQHISESTNSPFLPHGVPTQHAMFDRDYTRGFYQNGPYGFMNDKPYAAAAAAASAKLSHTTTPGMGQDREFVPRPNTAAAAAADSQMQDPYRHPMLYNMMNRYFE